MKSKSDKIDPEQVLKLAEKFWAKTEIAAFFNVHVDTLRDHFHDIYEKGREKGKAKLRDLQLQSAIKGNVTMQIWLGKQYLGQKEPKDTNEENSSGDTIIVFEKYANS